MFIRSWTLSQTGNESLSRYWSLHSWWSSAYTGHSACTVRAYLLEVDRQTWPQGNRINKSVVYILIEMLETSVLEYIVFWLFKVWNLSNHLIRTLRGQWAQRCSNFKEVTITRFVITMYWVKWQNNETMFKGSLVVIIIQTFFTQMSSVNHIINYCIASSCTLSWGDAI